MLEATNPLSPSFRGGEVSIKLADDTPGVGRAGQRVMLALMPDDVHDPTEIPTYLAGYSNGDYIADMVSPPILRDQDTDKFRSFTEDDTYLRVDVKGSIQGAIPEIDIKSSLSDYRVVDRFVGSFVPEVTEQNATAFNVRQAAGKRCANAILMDRELDVLGPAGLLSSAATWHASVKRTLDATTKWNGGASADPIADFQFIMLNSLARPTDAVMNLNVAFAFFNNESVKAYMSMRTGEDNYKKFMGTFNDYADSGIYSFTVPGFFGVRFHVTSAKYKENPGETPVFIMPNHVFFFRRPPGIPTTGEDTATSYTFRRRGVAGTGYETRQFRVDGRGPRGGTMIVVAQADIAKLTGPKIGGFIENAWLA